MPASDDNRVPAAVAARSAGSDEIDRYLFEITYDLAVSSLEQIISPSMTDFLA